MSASPRTGAGQHLPRLVFWEVTKGCNLRCVHCRATATELASPSDLPTAQALNIIDQIADFANPILVLSGGEPLYRPDIFQLAKYATDKGLRVALATNGTLVTKEVAQKIVDAGVKRVSISLDGANADTHDTFRGIPGAFDAAIYGFRNLKELGMPVQINMTIARHNAVELPNVLELVRGLGADALHTFLLVPVGCGVDIAESQMVAPEEYERILNWFYDQAATGDIELKATCAPHYFRVVRQRRAAERKQEGSAAVARRHAASQPAIGATEMTMPGSTGIAFKTDYREVWQERTPPRRNAAPARPSRRRPERHERHDQGLPCRNRRLLPLLRRRSLPLRIPARHRRRSEEAAILRDLERFGGLCRPARHRQAGRQVRLLRVPQRLHGLPRPRLRCHGNYMASEPFCVYQPKTMATKE